MALYFPLLRKKNCKRKEKKRKCHFALLYWKRKKNVKEKKRKGNSTLLSFTEKKNCKRKEKCELPDDISFLPGWKSLHSDVSSTNTQLAIDNLRCSHGWRKELLLHHLRLLLLVPCRLLSFAGASLLLELLVAAVAIAMPRDPRRSPRSLVRFRTHLFHVANWMYDFILF